RGYKQSVLCPRQVHDVVDRRLLTGTQRMSAGDRLANLRAPRCRRVMCVARSNAFYGALDHRLRCLEVRVADTQDDDILAAIPGGGGFHVRQPRIGAVAADPLDEWGEFHAR